MEFKVISDIGECEKLWRMFNTEEDWWDLWEVRKCFILEGNDHLYFIVGYENNEIRGVFPLCFNEEQNCHVPLGYLFPERNKFLLKDKKQIPLFLEKSPKKVFFCCIDKKETEYYPFESNGYNYFLDLTKFNTINDYLKKFSPRHRGNLLYDLKKISNSGYYSQISNKAKNEIECISKFNIERFENDSSFVEKGHKKSMENLISLAESKGLLQMISILKDSELVAAEFAVLYKGSYIVHIGGSDPKINNLGKLLIFKHIENAINLRAKKLDFMGGGDSWKKLWQMSTEEMFKYDTCL